MFNFQQQAAYQAQLAHVYTGLAGSFKAEVSEQDFIEEFPVIEINGRGVVPDTPAADSPFLLTDAEFARVVAAFDAAYGA
jgi:hypothetical protein